MKRKGNVYAYTAGSVAFFVILNMLIVSFPAYVEGYTGINTTQLQDATNVSADVDANQTDSSNVVEQAGALVSVYTNFNSENLILSGIGTVFLLGLIVLLLDLIWVG